MLSNWNSLALYITPPRALPSREIPTITVTYWKGAWVKLRFTWNLKSFTCVRPSVYSWVASRGSIHTTRRSCSISPPRMLVWRILVIFWQAMVILDWLTLGLHLPSVHLREDVERWQAHRTPHAPPTRSEVQERLSSCHCTSPCISTDRSEKSQSHDLNSWGHLWESISPSVTGSFAPSNVFPLLRSPKSAWFLALEVFCEMRIG